jgi:hypothetical protein
MAANDRADIVLTGSTDDDVASRSLVGVTPEPTAGCFRCGHRDRTESQQPSRSRPMNAYAMLAADEALRVANQRIADLRREAQNERLASASRPRRRIAHAVRGGLSALRGGFDAVDTTIAVPRLADYPYRP